MPAMRATAKASPLGRLPRRMRVWAEISTRQEASAIRRVTCLSETSTMCAPPCGSRCEKLPCVLMPWQSSGAPYASILPTVDRLRLAIVVPALNEEEALARMLPHALAAGDEVVVSDGGSSDRTVEIAAGLGARVVAGPCSRGGQLNRGAAATASELLLFLHADTRLPP